MGHLSHGYVRHNQRVFQPQLVKSRTVAGRGRYFFSDVGTMPVSWRYRELGGWLPGWLVAKKTPLMIGPV